MNIRTFHEKDRPALRVLVYTPIPSEEAYQPISRSLFERLRNRMRRHLELLTWRATGIWRAHYSTFEDTSGSNSGDIAIRVAVVRQLERLLAGRRLDIIEVSWGKLGEAIEIHGTPDLIVIAGGGFLFADRDGCLPPRFIADITAMDSVSCSVIGVSLGLNHHLTRYDKETFRFDSSQHEIVAQFMKRIDLCSVRDRTTQEAIAAVTGDAPPIVVDPAFLVGARMPLWRGPAAQRSTLMVGVNVSFHGAYATAFNRTLLTTLARALYRLAANNPVHFVYFIHSDGERGIVTALRRFGIPLTVIEGDIDMMLRAYRQLDIHVCQMLHSAILATSVGVPTLNLAYDIKCAAFFDLLELPRWCRSDTDLSTEELFVHLTELLASRDEIVAHLAAQRVRLTDEATPFYRSLAALAGGRLAQIEHLSRHKSCM